MRLLTHWSKQKKKEGLLNILQTTVDSNETLPDPISRWTGYIILTLNRLQLIAMLVGKKRTRAMGNLLCDK